MSDDPFAEPEDDRTVIRPSPGGRRRTVAPQPVAPPPRQPVAPRAMPLVAPLAPPPADMSPAAGDDARTLPISVTPLAGAAAPLLQLLARLRNTAHQPDAGNLRERTVGELREFERRAREAGIPMDQLRPAHFALCASIDDVVLNTPWGASSEWATKPLLSTFHHGARGSDQLIDLLRQLRKSPEKLRPAIELVYLCVSLGFAGRSETMQPGGLTFDQLREQAYTLIAPPQQVAATPLSRRWQGIPAPYRGSRSRLPVWVAGTLALAACGGLFVWTSTGLNAASDSLQAEVLAVSPGHMPQVTRAALVRPVPPAPPPPEPTALDQLQSALKTDIDKGLLSVSGTSATPVLRVPARGLFAPNRATLLPAAGPLLDRIAASLKDLAGSLRVVGYTDNQPIRTVQFPSNFQLSTARAQAVRSFLANAIGDASRVTAEGRADADPVAPNTTADGREQNRRIEIILRRPD